MDGESNFFALVFRMRNILRWGLMRNTFTENVQEQSHMVAVLAHALAVIGKDVFDKDLSPEKAATAALFHDASEIFTGDLPTPVKYRNPDIMNAYKKIEQNAADRLIELLPGELRPSYEPLLSESDPDIRAIVKAADKLAAYIKCLEELKAGNLEFSSAERQIRTALNASPLPEVKYFLEHFISAFELTLDELTF